MLDIRRAIEFLTEDPKVAEKVGLGALILITPVLNMAAFGYEVELSRRVAGQAPAPLPEWGEIGRLWRQGGWLGLATLIYSLPIYALMLAGMALIFVAILGPAQNGSGRAGSGTILLFAGFAVLVIILVLYS